MKMKFIAYILLFLASFLPHTVYSQDLINYTYFCGFEDPVENAKWTRVSATGTLNRWEIGTAEKSEGDSALYISYDGGITAGCNNTKNYVSAYRVVTLEAGDSYEISFDWKNAGYGTGRLYVCWVPDNVSIPFSQLTDVFPTTNFNPYVKVYEQNDGQGGGYVLSAAPVWQNMTFTVMGTGNPYKLLFLWQNSSSSMHPSKNIVAAGCVDNVQIAKKYDCMKPENFKYSQLDATRGKFSWTGGAGPFEIKYKGTFDSIWTTISNIGAEEILVRPLQKGSYIAAIRSICESDPILNCHTCPPDTSIYAVYPNILVHYSNAHCIDFLNFDNPAIATVRWGPVNNPFLNREIIDYGFASEYSRHTIHYLADEYDALTNYELKTIPPDGMPSVRLGNSLTPAHGPGFPPAGASEFVTTVGGGEAIEYSYVVSEEASLLLIKYAIVLNDAGHVAHNQPVFEINIFDEKGKKASEFMCGEVKYIADLHAPGWKLGNKRPAPDGTAGQIIWKDWATVGLNLENVVGQKITVQFVTRDCAQGGHEGYAYFTMDCMSAKISGVGCGDQMFGKVEAPDGFRYQWYPKYLQNTPELQAYLEDPLYADTLQSYVPLGGVDDTGTYICRVISKDEATCYFELEANLDPRDVYAEFEPKIDLSQCKAEVALENTSYTMTRNGKEKGECDDFFWYLNGELISTEENPVLNLLQGTYKIELFASISDGLCEGQASATIVIPEIKEYSDTTYAQTCTSAPDYYFEGKIYSATGKWVTRYTSIYGCDSIKVLDLTVASERKEVLNDTTTTRDEYYFYGEQLVSSGIYTHYKPGFGGQCDTIVELHLLVDTVLHVLFSAHHLPEICSGDPDFSTSYEVNLGTITSYSLLFGAKAQSVGFSDLLNQTHTTGIVQVNLPHNVRPDIYDARFIFYGGVYGNDTIDFMFDVYYSSGILKQKWNDVIAVYKEGYGDNHDYDFSDFSWYVDGVEIPNQKKSYIYIPEELNSGAEYRVKLTRADDGVSMFSCSIVPTMVSFSALFVEPTLASSGSTLSVRTTESGHGELWDVMGNKVQTINLNDGINHFNAPERSGVYVFKFLRGNKDNRMVRIIVK